VIAALERRLRDTAIDGTHEKSTETAPSVEAIEAAIQASLARVASGQGPLRTLGLYAGTIWMADDVFMDTDEDIRGKS